MKPKSLLWLAMITPIAAAPATSQLSLVNEAGFNQINVTVDPGSGLADTDVTTLSGTVDAQFDIDPVAGTASQLTLSNGRASGTNMSFSNSLFLIGGYNIDVTNLSSTLYTIVPPGTVNPLDGSFAANQHRFDIDQGSVIGSTNGLIGNNAINETFTPANPLGGTGVGTGNVALTNLGDSGNFRIFNTVVTLPVTVADAFLVGSTNVDITGNGTLKFSGTVQVPTTATVADTVWNGSVSQDWNNPFNWSNGVPQENAPQWSAVINTAAGNFPSITSAGTYQSDWDIVVGGGTNGRLDQSAGTVATGAGNWFFLGWQGAQGTYNQTGSGSLRVGGVANPTGNMLIGLDNGTVSTWNVNTTGSTLAGGIFAGCNGAATGIINMTAGTVDASGEMQIGGSFFNNGGAGELNMTGGVMTANIVAFARGGNNVAAVSGTGVISGGTLNSRQWFTLGFAGGSGNIANVTNSGGTINVNTAGGGVMEMGVFDATTNIFTQDSGSLNLQNNASISFGQGGNHTGASTFTQNGGTVTFFSDAGSTVGGTGSLILGNGGSIGSYAYNLNGGTLTTPSITKAAPGANGSFTFNGGTLRPTGSTATFMQGLSTASIQIGGANIDTNGNDITIAQALLDSGGGLTKLGAGTLTLAGVNTYVGDTTVQSGGQLSLADNAQIRFVVGLIGENNRLTGAGTVQLDGDFNIDVSSADGTVGNSWTLVDAGTLAETYGSTFTVAGWTETSAGVWLSPQGGYRFTESSGILDVINVNPFIVQQPASVAAQEGSTASLVVVATGNGNLTYQWFKDGTPLPGETGSTLSIVNVDSGDEGSYTVEITDDVEPGLVTMSSAAIVSVFPAWSGLVSHDPFATSGTYGIGELSAQNPTINGYVGAWTEIDFGDSQPAVSAGSLAYGNPSYLGSTGGKVTVQSDITEGEITPANSGRIFRQLSPQLVVGDSTSGVRYLSFLFQSGQETGATSYQALALYNANTDDASRNFDIGLTTNGGFSGSEYNFGVDGGYSGTGVTADSGVRLMVVKFNLSSTPFSDSVTVWVDPVLGSGEPVGGTTVDFADLNWDRLALSDYDGNSAAWDEIRWGSSFDSVTLNPSPSNTYASWISGYPAVGALSGFNDDADRDGIVNGIENLFGTNPAQSSQGIVQVASSGNTVTFQHPENASPAADIAADYVWSTDLVTFRANGATAGGITVNFTDSTNTPVAGTTTVTATVTGAMPPKLFISLKATQAAP